jgi:hypothetical protein
MSGVVLATVCMSMIARYLMAGVVETAGGSGAILVSEYVMSKSALTAVRLWLGDPPLTINHLSQIGPFFVSTRQTLRKHPNFQQIWTF